MSRYGWELRRYLEIPGLWRWILCAGVFAMPFIVVFLVHPAMSRLDLAQRHHEALKSLPVVQSPHSGRAASASAASGLPSYRSVPQSLAKMFAIARELDVMLDIGDYRYQRKREESFGRYQIELPVTADYPTLRLLIARLLNELPNAALDEISMVRESAASETIRARLRITLFLSES